MNIQSFGKEIGHGGFGRLYKKKLPNGRYVCLKVIQNHKDEYYDCIIDRTRCNYDDAISNEIINEDIILNYLKKKDVHNYVNTIIATIYNKKETIFVLELMNMDLLKWIRRDYLYNHKLVKNYLFKILNAVQYIHKMGVIHCDLKPANILLKENNIKLCDFGISLFNENQEKDANDVFTSNFRPPEIFMKFKHYNTKSDIWSVGCIFYEMIQRKALFHKYDTLMDIEHFFNIFELFGIPETMPTMENNQIYWINFSFKRMAQKMIKHWKIELCDILRLQKFKFGISDNKIEKKRVEENKTNFNSIFASQIRPFLQKSVKSQRMKICFSTKKLTEQLILYFNSRKENIAKNRKQLFENVKVIIGKNGVDLLSRLLTYNPSLRIDATQAICHPFFDELKRSTY